MLARSLSCQKCGQSSLSLAERSFPASMVCWSEPEPCKSILPHSRRLNHRALGRRFILALVGSGEGRWASQRKRTRELTCAII